MDASEPMRAALAAGHAVRGSTSPNPWVGAVVVRDATIIASGATEPPGGRHAEAVALDVAGPAAAGADLYVTLEPCAPFPGKRTRPCSERIVQAGVRRVVVALADSDARVGGRGIAFLRENGVEVAIGDGADEAIRSLRPYLHHRRTGMPYVIAKFAASLDGRIATSTGDSQWITGEAARDLAHQQRAWVDAVLVGSGTVLADNPSLTARPGGVAAGRQPVRVVLDARGRTPPNAILLAQPGRTVIATTTASSQAWRDAISRAGAQLLFCEAAESGGVTLRQLLLTLGQRDVLSLWVEGGGSVLGAFFDDGLVDEVWAFIAPLIIGGTGARASVGGEGARTIAEAWRLIEPSVEQLGPDVVIRGYINSQP
jgi:diaminohydroxyphosphoribosylaminopyrimidine deaminase/5-amino-6-(5-phosphoribosylamino)uracil reductase